MIPLNLRFAGLNSYRSQQEINFQELAAEGLFGIFGVTGAGKSTILDAMTLALFGVVNRAPRGTQGMINSREKSCSVSFSFRLGQHTYRAERVFERAKGEAFSAQGKSCRLICDDGVVMADKAELMNAAIKKLLNMDCQRFCQTVILPQGKFDQLLKLRPGERSALFEELFHFQAYGKSLSNRANQELRLAEAALQAVKDQLAMLGEHDEAYIDSLHGQLAASELHAKELAKEIATVSRRLQRLELLAEQAAERETCQQGLAELGQQDAQIGAQREQLQLAEQAEPLRELLQQAVSLHQHCREAVRLAEQAKMSLDEALSACSAAGKAAEEAAAHYQKEKEEAEPQIERLRLALHEQERLLAEEQALDMATKALAEDGIATRLAEATRRLQDAGEQLTTAEKKAAQRRSLHDAAFADWQQAVAEADRLRRLQAASLLSAALQEGAPCPVCGSCEHPAPAAFVDESAASGMERERKTKLQWQQLVEQMEQAERDLCDFREKKERIAAEEQRCAQELATRQAALHTMEQAVVTHRSLLRQMAGGDDPQAMLVQLQKGLAQAQEQAERTAQALLRCKADEQEKQLAAAQANGQAGALQAQFDSVREHLLQAVLAAGFQEANMARQCLLPQEERQRLRESIANHEDRRRSLQERLQRLESALADYVPARLIETQAVAEQLSLKSTAEQELKIRLRVQLEKAENDRKAAAGLGLQQTRAQSRVDVLRRLSSLLKGNAFVRYLARNAMHDLALEASHILLSLTASRYRLELFENARDSDFIMVDLYNGGMRRPVAGLSGGETFLVSLALALALSQRIEMSSVPLGFFFLDEGFGSLDDGSLEAVLDVLERLPSDRRAVGVITHVRAVQERIPRYLEVSSDPVHGSTIRLCKN